MTLPRVLPDERCGLPPLAHCLIAGLAVFAVVYLAAHVIAWVVAG